MLLEGLEDDLAADAREPLLEAAQHGRGGVQQLPVGHHAGAVRADGDALAAGAGERVGGLADLARVGGELLRGDLRRAARGEGVEAVDERPERIVDEPEVRRRAVHRKRLARQERVEAPVEPRVRRRVLVPAGLLGGVRELHREREDLAPAAVALERELAERVERLARDSAPVHELVQLLRQRRLVVERLPDGGGDDVSLLPVERAVLERESVADLAAGEGRERRERGPGAIGQR